MKVYIVRYGEYSDQGIQCVFSKKEEAEFYCDIHNQIDDMFHYDYWVDERELDNCVMSRDTKVVTYYMCWIDLEDGEIEDLEDIMEKKDIFTKESYVDKGEVSITGYSTKSPEHARKITLDAYHKWQAQQEADKGNI